MMPFSQPSPSPSFLLDIKSSPSGLALSKRISEAVLGEIRRGRWLAGDRLPSSRALAKLLGVHRNTVLASFEELGQQGYLETQPGRGSFVSSNIPEASGSSSRKVNEVEALEIRLTDSPALPPRLHWDKKTLFLLGGLPDLSEVPAKALARAYRAALKNSIEVLDYQSEFGQERFIRNFSQYLASNRGVVAGEGEMIVTRGSQQALHLAALALARPGSTLAVEAAGYPPAWEGFRMAGGRLSPIAVDAQGLDVEGLAALCEREDVSAVYVTPHHQYPTTVTMSGARRMSLLDLAWRKNFVVIEDDYDHEFHFASRPVLPLASNDERGVVLHIGTLSKVFSPGLRLGYAVGQRSLIKRMAQSRLYLDRQGDHIAELALAYMIEDGELQSHTRKMHRSYQRRREAFLECLKKELPEELSFDEPAGGLAIWARVKGGVSAHEWQKRAAAQGLVIQAAKSLSFDAKDHPYLRLGFARHQENELRSAIRILKETRPTKLQA